MSSSLSNLGGFLVALAVCAAAAPAIAQQPASLPMGKPAAGTASPDKPAAYQFSASTAGLLTVAVHGGGDLTLQLVDSDGQQVIGGSSDRDLFGSTGIEQLLVTITEAGTYRVIVEQLDPGAAKFEIAASWTSFPAFARPADPDRRPALARALDVGKPHEDSLDVASGDLWDWFVLTPATTGTLTVILRPVGNSEIDLALEIFTGDDFSRAAMRSDQDLQGNTANESATIDVKAGQKIHIRVSGGSTPSGRYRISSSLIEPPRR